MPAEQRQTTIEASYTGPIWQKFQDGRGNFLPFPWPPRNKNRLRDTMPSIFGSYGFGSGRALSRPTLVAYIHDGQGYRILVEEGICLVSQYTWLDEPTDDQPMSRETTHRLDDAEFLEAIKYARSVSAIEETGILNGIEKRRKATVLAESERAEVIRRKYPSRTT